MSTENKIRVGRQESWYRPYFLEHHSTGKTYKVDQIIFYKNNEIILTCGKWLEKHQLETFKKYCGGVDVEEIFINSPVKKLKENLTLKENYFISKTNQFNEKVCYLYIYVDDVNIKINQLRQETQLETVLDVTDYNVTYTEYELIGLTEEPFTTVKRQSDAGTLNAIGKQANELVETNKNNYKLASLSIYDWAEILKHYDLIKK